MSIFKSNREKRLWFWSFMVLIVIFSTLFIGQPLLNLFGNQNIQAIIFLLGMILVGIAILIHASKSKPNRKEIVIWLGIIAVYIMFILRLGLAERSHLFEYSVLAIFIHKAILERGNQNNNVYYQALLALILTIIIGALDECIQLFLPNRVFDPVDILFNSFVAFTAIGTNMLLQWVRMKYRKK